MERLCEPAEYEAQTTKARRAAILAEDLVHRIALRIADENTRRRAADVRVRELHESLNALHSILSSLKIEDASDGRVDDMVGSELSHALDSADGAVAVAQK